MTAEEVAHKHARSRPGYELVSYREVALPLFRVDLELLVLERKDIPPIQEYVLRAVALGLVATPDIAGFLGLEEQLVRSAAAQLLSDDNLVMAGGGDGDRQHRLTLSKKGQRTVVEAAHVQAEEVELPVWIDGLTRRVLSVAGKGRQWFPASHASRRGLVEIGAYPKKRPGLESIPLDSVRDVIRSETAGRRAQREVIGITGMGKARRFAREAVALAYQAPDDELLVSLFIDGEPSDEHDAIFATATARSPKKLIASDWHDASEILNETIPPEVASQVVDSTESERLEDERDDAKSEGDRLEAAAETAEGTELESLRQQLQDAKARALELQTALDNISVRQVPVYEHRTYLDRALREAQTRVLIVSPWIRSEVVDNELLSRFRHLLDRGVALWIGFGINKTGGYRPKAKGEADREAEAKLRRLGNDYKSLFRMTRLGDTHAKVLVCDSRFSILTSFNWLSFRGDEQLEFRDERGYYVGLNDRVDDLFESYRIRFDEPAERQDGGPR